MFLRQMVSNRMNNLLCHSFINGSIEQRKYALVFNRLQNAKMKCEIIKDANVRETVWSCGVEMTIRKVLPKVKVNNKKNFRL